MASKALSVAVRCRPALPHDRDQRVCIQVVGANQVQCLDPEQLHEELREKHGRIDYLKAGHNRERSYTFDQCFGPSTSNEVVFEHLVKPLVPHVVAGKHVTCFAYGQTGSGKTHTMLGRKGETGLVERTLIALLSDAPGDTTVTVTFVEVYNELIRDLLSPACPALELREDPVRGSMIAGVQEVPAKTAESVMKLVQVGNDRRTEESTAANPVSSRSHAILQLNVETPLPPTAKGARRLRTAKLSLIDLAGSERAANTGNRGIRLREGAMINRSLLALANCITALTRKGAYVNYRDSKLTRLLKDSLSGNCYTVMIAHVSPSITSFEETINTMKYAHRACEIRGMGGGVRENVCVVAPKYVERMQACFDATNGLRQTISRLGQNLGVARPAAAPGSEAPTAAAAGEHLKLLRKPSRRPPQDSHPLSPVVALADKLEKSRRTVIGKMRERMRIEQTVLELDDQNEANVIELSKLELDAMCGAPAPRSKPPKAPVMLQPPGDAPEAHAGNPALQEQYSELQTVRRRNDVQRQHVVRRSENARLAGEGGEDERKLVTLLTEAKSVVESDGEGKLASVEKRLLHAQHGNTLLELEKIETEQANVLMEAAARKHQLVLRKQAMQLDIHQRALAVAEALLERHGLGGEWLAALGPLAKVLPGARDVRVEVAPSVDELLAELIAPVAAPKAGSPEAVPDPTTENARLSPVDDAMAAIDEDFDEMRMTLNGNVKFAAPSASETEKISEADEDLLNDGATDDFGSAASMEEEEYSQNFSASDGADGEAEIGNEEPNGRARTLTSEATAMPRDTGADTSGRPRT